MKILKRLFVVFVMLIACHSKCYAYHTVFQSFVSGNILTVNYSHYLPDYLGYGNANHALSGGFSYVTLFFGSTSEQFMTYGMSYIGSYNWPIGAGWYTAGSGNFNIAGYNANQIVVLAQIVYADGTHDMELLHPYGVVGDNNIYYDGMPLQLTSDQLLQMSVNNVLSNIVTLQGTCNNIASSFAGTLGGVNLLLSMGAVDASLTGLIGSVGNCSTVSQVAAVDSLLIGVSGQVSSLQSSLSSYGSGIEGDETGIAGQATNIAVAVNNVTNLLSNGTVYRSPISFLIGALAAVAFCVGAGKLM